MSTTIEQNKAITRRFFEAWNMRQPEAFDELVARDVVRHCQATPGVDIWILISSRHFSDWIPGSFLIRCRQSNIWLPMGISSPCG